MKFQGKVKGKHRTKQDRGSNEKKTSNIYRKYITEKRNKKYTRKI